MVRLDFLLLLCARLIHYEAPFPQIADGVLEFLPRRITHQQVSSDRWWARHFGFLNGCYDPLERKLALVHPVVDDKAEVFQSTPHLFGSGQETDG